MRTAHREVGAAKFKAECLALMDEVQEKRIPLTVTKNGRRVVTLLPAEEEPDPFASLYFGPIQIHSDLDEPSTSLEEWDALR